MILRSIAAAICAMAMIGASPPSVTQSMPVRIVDTMPAFWRVYDGTYPSPKGRAEAFKQQVVLPNLGAFINDEFAGNLMDDAAITDYFQRLAPEAPAARAISERMRTELPEDLARFSRLLPDFDSKSIYAIYVMPSFFHFAGQTRDMGKQIGVFFGPDMLALFYGPNVNVGVITSHELFHIYQFEKSTLPHDEADPLWLQVWIEGSAAYASQHIAVHATVADALNARLASADASTQSQLACTVLKSWSSTESSASNVLLDASAHPLGLPAMGGYLVGYGAAQTLAKMMSLSQIGQATNSPQFAGKFKAIVSSMCAHAQSPNGG